MIGPRRRAAPRTTAQRLAWSVLLALAGASPGAAQAADSARRPAFHLEMGGYVQRLNNGYGEWRGLDARLQHAGRRWTPWVAVSSQTRAEGSQGSVGVGSYLVPGGRAYFIVGASAATGGEVVLFPRLRVDATALVTLPAVPGLVLTGGVTEVRFGSGAGGQILSAGSLLYRGPAILNGTVRLNHDAASGAWSHSAQVGGQVGAQGVRWLGGSVGWGREAYAVLAATPFDVRFRSLSGSLFGSWWLSRDRGVTVRYDFEHKYEAYRRHGASVSLFVDF